MTLSMKEIDELRNEATRLHHLKSIHPAGTPEGDQIRQEYAEVTAKVAVALEAYRNDEESIHALFWLRGPFADAEGGYGWHPGPEDIAEARKHIFEPYWLYSELAKAANDTELPFIEAAAERAGFIWKCPGTVDDFAALAGKPAGKPCGWVNMRDAHVCGGCKALRPS